jgi:transcription elongation factor GreB
MSRGFVKEDDQEEAPFVPPRAPLPDHLENLVTPTGYSLLINEKAELQKEFKETDQLEERERRRKQAVINVQLKQLEERIQSARIIEPDDQLEEVRFGKVVCFRPADKQKAQCFRIVGVDEANLKEGKVSFTAPIIRAMLGKKKGESFVFEREGKDVSFEIADIKA